MIEVILQAERALTAGMVDQAERLYGQAIEHDPRNSIAVVGLARVALERGDDRAAYRFARRALEIDPENAAARRMVARLSEVMAYRGEAVPDDTEPVPDPKAGGATEPVTLGSPASTTTSPPARIASRGLLDRIRGRR